MALETKKFGAAIEVLAAFVKAVDLDPEKTMTLIAYLTEHNLPFDWATLCDAHEKLSAGYYSGLEQTASETAAAAAETGLTAEEIENWTASELREALKTRASEIERVLRRH
jgi:hypothetical protein